MLKLKPATSKRWKEIEKKPIHRKTISTDIKRNTNKRFNKLLIKDAKKLKKLGLTQPNMEEFEDEVEDQNDDN